MLSNMKTSIFTLADLSWDTLAKIKRWFRPDITRHGFALQSFDNNASLKVVEVHNSVGQTVALCPIEPCFLVNMILNPEATRIEIGVAGNNVDRGLELIAQQEGMTRFLIVCPPDYPSQPDEKWVRVVERQVPQVAAMQCTNHPSQPHTALSN
jgi:hypothetical protein